MSGIVQTLRDGVHKAWDKLDPQSAKERDLAKLALRVAQVVATVAMVYFAVHGVLNPLAGLLFYGFLSYVAYEVRVVAGNELNRLNGLVCRVTGCYRSDLQDIVALTEGAPRARAISLFIHDL